MNWKEFFKLTKQKVFLTIILLILGVIGTAMAAEVYYTVAPGGKYPQQLSGIALAIGGFLSNLIFWMIPLMKGAVRGVGEYIGWFLSIVWSYILASLIIYFYQKSQKPKSKKK
ncbi:MAG TPA: hypothetical protein VI933_03910 [archaeon]|nr:hypothetical protein [archaeon]